MKKLITLLLVLTGAVCSANATDYYVLGASQITNGNAWTKVDATKMSTTDNIHYYYVANNCELTAASSNDDVTNVYNFQIQSTDGTWGEFRGDWSIRVKDSGVYTIVILFDNSQGENANKVLTPILVKTLSLNSTFDGVWNATSNTYSFSHSDGSLKWTLDIPSSSVTASEYWYSFFNDGNYYWNNWYYEIFPGTNETVVGLGNSTNGNYESQNNRSNRSFKLNQPSFTYNHLTFTLEYDVINYCWNVKTDAYISKEITAANQYATVGCSVPLDLSGLAAEGVTAYPLTANATTGKITKGAAITGVLAANTGALLETNANVTLSIPVSATAGAAISNNLVACTTGSVAKVTETDYTNYILANQDGHVGFYRVNSAGNEMGDNTAYLHVADGAAGSARAFYLFGGESTSVESVKQEQKVNGEFFNLAGQRVAQPTKGLYIVNGKKVTIK